VTHLDNGSSATYLGEGHQGAAVRFPARRVELTGSESRPADGRFDEHRVDRRVWLERLLIEEDVAPGLVERVAISLPRYSTAANLVRRGDMISTCRRALLSAKPSVSDGPS
jgi:hypothetical protein